MLHSCKCTNTYQWIEKIECNRDRGGRTQSSHSRHNPQIIWDMRNRLVNSLADDFLLLFGYFWFSSSFFFRCAVILSFSQAVTMLSSHPTPKENNHLLSPSLIITTDPICLLGKWCVLFHKISFLLKFFNKMLTKRNNFWLLLFLGRPSHSWNG